MWNKKGSSVETFVRAFASFQSGLEKGNFGETCGKGTFAIKKAARRVLQSFCSRLSLFISSKFIRSTTPSPSAIRGNGALWNLGPLYRFGRVRFRVWVAFPFFGDPEWNWSLNPEKLKKRWRPGTHLMPGRPNAPSLPWCPALCKDGLNNTTGTQNDQWPIPQSESLDFNSSHALRW